MRRIIKSHSRARAAQISPLSNEPVLLAAQMESITLDELTRIELGEASWLLV